MSETLAIAALITLFVIFGLVHRGASKPSCGSCKHGAGSEVCGSCGLGEHQMRDTEHRH